MQNLNYLDDNHGLSINKVQWQCLKTVSKRYRDVNLGIIGHKSVFEDPIWENNIPLEPDIKWDRTVTESGRVSGQFEDDQYPLMLLCKIWTYRDIALLGGNISQFRQCQSFYNFFSETLRAKRILTGNKNELIKPLSDLTCDDIRFAAQLYLTKSKGKLSTAPFAFLQKLKELPFEAIKEAPFLSLTTEFPWEQEGISVTKWVRQLKISNGHTVVEKSYPPIAFEKVSKIVDSAMGWIDNLELLKYVFDTIKENVEKNGHSQGNRVRKSITDKIIAERGIELNALLPITTTSNSSISQQWYTDLLHLAHGAAIWIILLTTGLRNVDVRNLQVGNCNKSNRSDLLYYLVTNIKKTGQKNYILPVPKQTKLATELLDFVRLDHESTSLLTLSSFSRATDYPERSSYHDGGTLNNLLWFFLDHHEIPRFVSDNDETDATVHCVRATLAGWIGANSHMAILMIRKLFGHTNMIMPDAYLSHNPIIIKQRQENVTNALESLAEDMVDGMVSGKLSGTKGKQMLRGVDYVKDELSVESQSLTEMDMHVTLKERLKELLLQRITGGEVFAMLTPMGVICMRNCNDTSDTPCAKQTNQEKRKDKNISKKITDALGTLPNPGHCIGKDCSDAVLGEKWSQPLLETFEYYVNYLKGIGHQSIDMKFEAENFINEYGPLLKDIFKEVNSFD
jgi:hypothetical protein